MHAHASPCVQLPPIRGHAPSCVPTHAAHVQALSKVELHLPRVPVYSNVTAEPFPADPQQMRVLLARQLVEPVQVRFYVNLIRPFSAQHWMQLGLRGYHKVVQQILFVNRGQHVKPQSSLGMAWMAA